MDQINEYNNISETDDRREIIKQKLRQYYDGRIVRKDLTKSIREGANVPVYVLEYLLGQYCNSDDQEIIDEGVDNVKRILRDNYVRPDEAQKRVLNGKPAAVSGITPGMSGTLIAQDQLVTLLSFLNMRVMNVPRLTIPNALEQVTDGKLVLKESEPFLAEQCRAFINFIENNEFFK